MDQEKIGKFIAQCRKENGKNMPDASIMLELCELLKINVNELLTVFAVIVFLLCFCSHG